MLVEQSTNTKQFIIMTITKTSSLHNHRRLEQIHNVIETVGLRSYANVHPSVRTPGQIFVGVAHLKLHVPPEVNVQLGNANLRPVGHLQPRIHPDRHVRRSVVQKVLQRVQLLELEVREVALAGAIVLGPVRGQHDLLVGHVAGALELVRVEGICETERNF